ncbi:zinc finger BED domain-containing protein RICESLEEPER 2 [Tanacetum coccineum]
MDQQTPQQNNPYESISSSIPTFDSFSSQQNMTIEDETIDVETLGNEDKKRKRKAPTRKPKAECWKYFDQKFENDEDGVLIKMAYCKWCPAVFKADSQRHGTRHLNNHYPNCESNPDVEKLKKQKKLAFKKSIGEKDEGGTSSGTLETWKYDEKVIKESLIRLIVLAELPFKFVEHPAFIKFSSDMQPRFNMPSRFKIDRDISKFYLEERKGLVNFLSNSSTTVHLTTDTWTSSCKRMNFMVLTAYFIDDDWNIMTMTVDNIASNDKALEYLLENLPTKYDDGKHFHVRCMAHILNLVVKDGLKDFKKEVETIASAVKYIKHSSQRVTNFKESVENACASNKFLISECPTRWNSTHDMLKTAIELKDVFFDYDFNNSCFARDLEEIPKRADFEGDPTMKSEIIGYGFRHLIENGCILMEVDEESEKTPIQFLTDEELSDKLVKKVEKDMRVLFAMYKEKYDSNVLSDMPKSTSSQTTNTSRRRGGTGRQAGRGGGRTRGRSGNQGDGRNDGPGGQVGGQGSEVNGGVDGFPNFSTIIAQQLQNLLPTIVAQVGNQGRGKRSGRNQNDKTVNDHIRGDLGNATEGNDRRGCTYEG